MSLRSQVIVALKCARSSRIRYYPFKFFFLLWMPQSLEAGDLVEALPGNEVQGLYSPGDRGTAQSILVKDNGERRVLIVWEKSGLTSSMREEVWEHSVSFVRKQKLELGDLVRALPGKEMISGNIEYYKAGDEGTVQSFSTPEDGIEHVNVAWARTGQVSSVPSNNWMICCGLVKKQEEARAKGTIARIHGLQGAKHLNGSLVTCESWDAQKGRWTVRLENGEEKSLKPENLLCGKGIESLRPGESPKLDQGLCIGDLVRANDGNKLVGFYEGSDEGTIQDIYIDEDGEERLRIVWGQSGKAASIRKKDAIGGVSFLRKQVLEPGDTVQALPGMELTREGKEYYKAGEEATVIETIDAGKDGYQIRLLWEHSGTVSDLPKAQWMSFVRIVRKGAGATTKGYVGNQASQQVQQKPLKVGQRARVQGLQSAANRNGSIVECKKWDEVKSRWLVHIVTDELLLKPIEMSIKPDNLVPM